MRADLRCKSEELVNRQATNLTPETFSLRPKPRVASFGFPDLFGEISGNSLSPTHLSIYRPDTVVLFAGDRVKNQPRFGADGQKDIDFIGDAMISEGLQIPTLETAGFIGDHHQNRSAVFARRVS